jgi:hypothetical protein
MLPHSIHNLLSISLLYKNVNIQVLGMSIDMEFHIDIGGAYIAT